MKSRFFLALAAVFGMLTALPACAAEQAFVIPAPQVDNPKVAGTEQKAVLLRIADELLAREVLDADQVLRLAQGLPLEDRVATAPVPAADDTPRRETHERPFVPALGKAITQE